MKGSVSTMEQGSLEKLKFDNRLSRRKGWLSKDENEANLQSLPDVSDKISTPEDEVEEAVAEASEAASQAEPQAAFEAVPAFAVQTEGVPAAQPEPEGELLADPLSPPPFEEL